MRGTYQTIIVNLTAIPAARKLLAIGGTTLLIARAPAGDAYGESAMKNLLDHLRDDHLKVRKLFRDFEAAAGESRREIAHQTLMELLLQASIEEDIVYPALPDRLEDRRRVAEAREEHQIARLLIADLWKLPPEDEGFAAKFAALAEVVNYHLQGVEHEMLPRLDRADERLAQRFAERKRELALRIFDQRGWIH
jgi:hypothetical protein